MNKENETTNTTNTATAKGQKPTLVLIRPIAAKSIADGYTLALQTRKGLSLIGEEQLGAFLAAEKKDGWKAEATPLAKATAKVADFPHLLAAAWELCVKHNFRPCRAIRLYGAGAAAKCADIDRARERRSELSQAVKAATVAMVEAIAKTGKVSPKIAKTLADAQRALAEYSPTFKKVESEYKAAARAAVALLTNIADMRRHDGDDKLADGTDGAEK